MLDGRPQEMRGVTPLIAKLHIVDAAGWLPAQNDAGSAGIKDSAAPAR